MWSMRDGSEVIANKWIIIIMYKIYEQLPPIKKQIIIFIYTQKIKYIIKQMCAKKTHHTL